MTYEDLAKSLRCCARMVDCGPECPRYVLGTKGCIRGLKLEAADTIEKLAAGNKKEKLELINLRNRVRAQREEIKRLSMKISMMEKAGVEFEEIFPGTLEELEQMVEAVGVLQ